MLPFPIFLMLAVIMLDSVFGTEAVTMETVAVCNAEIPGQ